MFDEITFRRKLLLMNAVIAIGCTAFLWMNDVFYPHYSSELNKEAQYAKEYLSLKPPEWLATNVSVPGSLTIGTPSGQEILVRDQILRVLNRERQTLSLQPLSQTLAYEIFAQKLALSLSSGAITFSNIDTVGFALASTEFRDRENRFALKAMSSIVGRDDMVAELAQGLRTPLLKDSNAREIGVGVVIDGGKAICAMYLADTLLMYDTPFPESGDVHISATLSQKHQGKSIQIRKTTFKRGWITPVCKNETIHNVQIAGGKLALDESGPDTGWTLIEFIVDGITWNRGRALRAGGA